MADIVNPTSALVPSFHSGAQLGLQVAQAQQMRRQEEWQRDIQMVGHFLKYAQAKNATPQTVADSVNQANTITKKWYPDAQFHALTPEQVPDYAPVLQRAAAGIADLEKGKGDPSFVISEYLKDNADFLAKAGKEFEFSKSQEAVRKDVSDRLTAMAATREKKDPNAKTPDEVMKEIFDMNTKMAGMQQLDQQTANLIQMNPEVAKSLIGTRLSPDQLSQVKGAAAARMLALNDLLPADKKLTPISQQEYDSLVTGNNPLKKKHTPEEIFRSSFILPTAK